MRKIPFFIGAILLSINVFGQSSEDFFRKGEIKKNAGDYRAAIYEYSAAINADAKNINAILQRAFCFNIFSEYDAAIKDYTTIIAIDKTQKFAYLSRGSAKNKLKQYAEAMVDFNKVLEIDPSNQEAYNNRGFSKKGLGDKDAACKDWQKSKKMGNKEAKIIIENNHCK